MSDESKALITFSDDDRQTIHQLITAQLGEQGLTVTPQEFTYFLRVAALRGLNPLFREVHLIKDRSGRINVQVGIDGFRKLAEDTGNYGGQTQPEWGPPYEGPVVEWQGAPSSVRVGVYRTGWAAPVWGEAWLVEDGQVKDEWRDGPGGKRERYPGTHALAQWAQRPRTMLKKVAEARAIRAAFPRSVAGLYTDDELPGHTAATLPAEASATPAATPPAETPAVEGEVIEGTWQPAPEPEGMKGNVRETPDGIRTVKSSAHPPRWEGTKPKLEVKLKVKNRNHTLILLDELAEAADAAGLLEGEQVIAVGARLEEREWQEGKPPIKELWDTTELLVYRDNEWRSVGQAERPRPVEDMPLVDSTGSTPPPEDAPPLMAEGPQAPVLTDGWAGQLKVKLLEPIKIGRTPRDLPFADLRLAVIPGGEVLRAALGDDPPGEIEAQLGPDDDRAFSPGDELIAVGTLSKGWLILTFIGKEAK